MLQWMRDNAGNWMIKIILGLIALAFALSFGVSSYFGNSQEVAVVVNGQNISMAQLREEQARVAAEARRLLGNQFSKLAPMEKLRQTALENLVTNTLLLQSAQEVGIVVSDQEVVDSIAVFPAFQANGRFDMRLYQRVLTSNRLTPEAFEVIQRGEIMKQKLSALVAGAAQVSPLEVKQGLTRELTKVEGIYKIFTPEEFKNKVKVSQAEIVDYYNNHKIEYAVPAKVVLSYLNFPLRKYRDQVKIADADLAEAYEMNLARYAQPEQVHARHILIKLPKNAAPAEVAKAKGLAADTLALAEKKGTDFAALAKKVSQDATKEKGGDLGYFKRGVMVQPFESLAFGLKPGQVGMVRTEFGFHIVKVEDHKKASVIPLKKVRGELKDQLTEKMSKDLAAAKAEQAFDLVAQGASLKEVAAKLGMSIEETAPLARNQEAPSLKGLNSAFTAVEGLSPGEVAAPMNYDEGTILPVVKKVIPETVKPLKEVEAKAMVAVREIKTTQAARAAAEKLLAQLRKESDPVAFLKKDKRAEETGLIGEKDEVRGLKGYAWLFEALRDRPTSSPVLTTPVSAGGGFVAAVLMTKKTPDKAAIEAQSKQYREQLLAQKRRATLNHFVNDLRARADIKVMAAL